MKRKIIWIADDGTEFFSEEYCREYETKKTQQHVVRIYINVEAESGQEAIDMVQSKLVGLFYKAPTVLSSIDLMEIRD